MSETDQMFDAAIVKLERANEHLEVIKKVALGYWHSAPARVVLKPSYHRFTNPPQTYLDITTTITEPPPGKMRAVLGDFFHNLRSSLDTVFFPLLKEKFDNHRRIQFIISESEERFTSDFSDRFAPHLNDNTIEAIERAKPFKDGNALLHAVSEFNNTDKHRYQILASTEGGTITREQLAAIVPPGTRTPPSQSIPLGGTLKLPVAGRWADTEMLQNFISSSAPLHIPAMLFLKPASFDYPQEICGLCTAIMHEFEKLVYNLISANK